MSVLPHEQATAAPLRAPFGSARHLHAVQGCGPEAQLDFDAAVRALTARLQRYATRRLGDRHEAEELVQEALLRAHQHRGELRTEDDVAAWTTCVTGRLVIDRLRVRGRSTPVADVPEQRSERDTADVVVARDQARTALDALDAMPPRQAAVLWAREVEGLGYDEIGARFGMTEPAVRSLLTRARKTLRKEYAARGGTLPAAGLAVLAPWVSGTGWLERLRSGLLKAAAPAALGVATAGLVTGALVAPAPPAPQATPVPAVVQTAAAPSALTTVAAAAPAAAPVPAAAADVETAAPPAPAARDEPRSAAGRVLDDSGVVDTCVGAAGAGAGGTGCAPPGELSTFSVDLSALPVPAPVAEQVPHVQTNRGSCQALPSTPVTRCTPAREDS